MGRTIVEHKDKIKFFEQQKDKLYEVLPDRLDINLIETIDDFIPIGNPFIDASSLLVLTISTQGYISQVYDNGKGEYLKRNEYLERIKTDIITFLCRYGDNKDSEDSVDMSSLEIRMKELRSSKNDLLKVIDKLSLDLSNLNLQNGSGKKTAEEEGSEIEEDLIY